jgi:BirA family transcriptional regulator, biotin operon repressor / biotin---[acetyl-CoA-carboxylase] ligase
MNTSKKHAIHRFESCESTNAEAQKYIISNSCNDLRVFISSHQTSGRGQAGAKWYDKPNTNALFTVILPVKNMSIRQLPEFNMFFSEVIRSALSDLVQGKVLLKWPNDLMYRNYKTGGILIETVIQGSVLKYIVAGVGINVGYAPEEIPHCACLQNLDGRMFIKDEIISHCIEKLYEAWNGFAKIPVDRIRADYHKNLMGTDGWYWYLTPKGKLQCKVIEVDAAGNLVLLHKDSGVRSVYRNKEISWCYDENPVL